VSNPPVIAIVDDDQAVRESLCDLLEVAGVATVSFVGAGAFLSAYVPDLFAGLITDVDMPGLNGLELQRRLRVLDPALPVIVISAAMSPRIRVQALEDGAVAYLTKPIDPDLLLGHVAAMLAAR
jgi:FixJ family two-component response regulator